MKKLATVLSLLLSAAAAASAAVTLTETTQVTLIRGSSSLGVFSSWDGCKARARELANADTRTTGKVTYRCQTERYQIIAAYSPDPPPPPPPPDPEPDPVPPPSGDTIRNGQLFNIVGSGFGAKTQAAPLVFDDFENGTGKVEGNSAVTGTWGRGDWSYAITYSTTQPLQGSKVAHHAFNSSDYNASLYVDPPSVPAVYMDFWMRVVPKSSALTRNFKPWRVYGAGNASTANDVIFCDSPGWVGLESGGGAWVQRARVWNAWEHYRIAIKFGANGLFSQHRDGIADVVRTGITAGGSPQGIRIGHYWATSADANCPTNPGADIYTDLVYVDTSLARVYLADAPTLSQAKHTAIQIPTAWADGAVTVTANTHGFKTGDAAHVIVVDAGNVERKTQPVTVQQ